MPEPIAIYPFRPGSEEEIAHTAKPDTIDLTETEKDQLVQFDSTLFHCKLPGKEFEHTSSFLDTEQPPSIEAVYSMRKASAEFIPEFFGTSEGSELLRSTAGVEWPDKIESAQLSKKLFAIDWSKVSKDDFGRLSNAGVAWATDKFVEEFAARNYKTIEGIADPEFDYVIRNPDELIEKTLGLSKIKAYLVNVRKDLKSLPKSHENTAKLMVAKIYSRYVNEELADVMPRVYDLIFQYRSVPTPRLRNQIEAVGQAVKAPLLELASKPRQAAKWLQRYSRYREGISYREGTMSPISAEVEAVAKESLREGEKVENNNYYFKDIDLEHLRKLKLEPEQVKGLFDYLLDQYKLLSSEKEVDLDRNGWAADNKWQAALDPKVRSLDVDPKRGLIHIPLNRKRSMIKEVPVICHELAHVFQTENRKRVLKLKLAAEVGTARHDVYSEGGGIMWEREAKQALFGMARKTSGHYLRAAQALLAGGGWNAAAKAYFDNAMASEPEANPRSKSKTAFKSAFRLLRAGGQWRTGTHYLTRSQPINYTEQALIADALNEGERHKLLIGRVNRHTLSDLEAIGLVDYEAFWMPDQLPWDLLKPKLSALIEEYLAR